MPSRWTAVALTILVAASLAGCLQPTTPPSDGDGMDGDGTDGPDGNATLPVETLTGTQDLMLTQATGGQSVSGGPNCMSVNTDGNATFVSVNGTLSWTAGPGGPQELQFTVLTPEGEDVRNETTGSSPLEVGTSDPGLGSAELVTYAVQLPEDSNEAAVNQSMTLEYEVGYRGAEAPETSTATCQV